MLQSEIGHYQPFRVAFVRLLSYPAYVHKSAVTALVSGQLLLASSILNHAALHSRFRAEQKPETGLRVFSTPREVDFMRWFPVAFLTNGVLKVTHGGIEQTTPVL